MPPDEALGLAQILLGLLLFTVGIPALIIEIRVEEPFRRLLHKRIRQRRMIRLGAVTLAIVGVLIFVSGLSVGPIAETLLKLVVILLIWGFTQVWRELYKNVSIELAIKDIVEDLSVQIREQGNPKDPDFDDLVSFGEHLKGGEKHAVVRAVGSLCRELQDRSGYDGTRLEKLLRGLVRIVIRDGTLEHHRSALAVVAVTWRTLEQRDLVSDRDATVLKEVAWTLGSLAVSQKLEVSIVLRWMNAFPRTIDVQYRIGLVAIRSGDFAVAIEALSRLSAIAETTEDLPKEFIAMVAHFHTAGPSSSLMAREFLKKLPSDKVRSAATMAADAFRGCNDYVTADAIEQFLECLR